jgi:uncharacterized protein YjbJ (UPF0337 family)
MSDKNTSTLQSYIDSASGTVQSAFGGLTDSTADKVLASLALSSSLSSYRLPFYVPKLTLPQNKGELKKSKGELENDASHATAKLGNVTASSSGAVTKDDPNRTEGSWNQTVGSAKEAVGGLVGSEVSPPISFPALPPFPPSH